MTFDFWLFTYFPRVNYAILFAASFAAGAINSVAGGGTLLTYPVLIFSCGLSATAANATSTMGLWPASLTGMLGFRKALTEGDHFPWSFFVISVIGGAAGSVLLWLTPDTYFRAVVPWLILFAAALFLLQETLLKRLRGDEDPDSLPPREATPGLLAYQFLVALYGGYFGAAIGILMLAAFGFMRIGNIYRMNFIKNFCALGINVAATLVFAWKGMIVWELSLVMAAAAILGGYFGAGLARKIGPRRLRVLISAIGITIAVVMFIKR